MLREAFLFTLLLTSCAGKLPARPCTEGGEAPRPGLNDRVTKQCFQKKEPSGRWVNDGPYIQWHPNGKRWVTGEYKMGAKNGKWEEWDPSGKKLSEKHYRNGKEVPRFATPDKPITATAAAPTDKVLAKPDSDADAEPVKKGSAITSTAESSTPGVGATVGGALGGAVGAAIGGAIDAGSK